MTQSEEPGDGTAPSTELAPKVLKVGSILAGRYRILQQLGKGATGSVYLAEHIRMGRRDAIKVLRKPLLLDAAALARFNHGARKVSKIRHQNVCATYDFSESDGVQFLAMEYVPGQTLRELLDTERALPLQRALSIAIQVASALQAAHDAGIVHGNLKPSNIMLVKGLGGADSVKVVDFDIARAQEDVEHSDLTGAGFVVGTPAYMSPEQLFGEAVDPRSDVYSLAVLVHQMLTGVLPFAGENTREMLVSRLTNPPLTLSESHPDKAFPAGVQPVLGDALRRNPDERIATAEAFARALTEAVGTVMPAERYNPQFVWAEQTERRAAPIGVSATQSPNSLFTPEKILSPTFPASTNPLSLYQSFWRRHSVSIGSATLITIALLTWGAWSVIAPVEPYSSFEPRVLNTSPTVLDQRPENGVSLTQKKAAEDQTEARTQPPRDVVNQPARNPSPSVGNPTVTTAPVSMVNVPVAPTSPTPRVAEPRPGPLATPQKSVEQPRGIRFQNVQNAITDQMRAVLMISSTGVAAQSALLAIRDTAEAAWTSSTTETERAKSAYILGSAFFHMKDRDAGLKWSRRALAHCEQAAAEPDTTIKSCESYRLLVELFELSRG